MSLFRSCTLMLLSTAFTVVNGQIAVPTAQYNNARTGANLDEVTLNTLNVNSDHFGRIFARAVDDSVYALPLYVPKLEMPDGDIHNVVYVATMSNTVYAFDADDPSQSDPLWIRNLGPAPSVSGNIQTHWGILGTPVIHGDTIYLVAYIGPTTDHWSLYLCALDIRTGADKFGPPSEVLFPFQGNLVPATPFTIQRAALLVANDTLYIGFANFQTNQPDRESQEGFVFSYSITDMTQPFARFQVTDGQGGDIWQAGRGLAADESGNTYVNTANGFYDGITNFGDSVLKFASDLSLVDSFTPHNWATLYQNNLDLSASGPPLIPGTNKLVAGGKEGVLYLLNQLDLGRLQNHRRASVQIFHATHGCFQTDCSQTLCMAYWDRQSDSLLYVWDKRDRLRVFNFDGTMLRTRPVIVGRLKPEVIGGVSISANGSQPGTGIVWAITSSQDAAYSIVPGTLRAYDATDVRHELWNSDLLSERDSMGNFTKFSSPVVANGKVYVITQSNQLAVYGLLHD